MKKIIALLTILWILSVQTAFGYWVKYQKWYTKKNGTYVEWHFKTKPNSSKKDNFSSQWNTNPYTGKKGYKKK